MTLVSSLLLTHSHYDFYRETFQAIKDLKEGYATILAKKEKYLPRRVSEEPDVYDNRLKALSYTNILNENVHRLASILTSAPVSIEYGYSQFWEYVLSHINGRKKTYNALRYDIYSSLLYYGRVYIGVDAPALINSARSRAEYLNSRLYPTVTLFNPLEVINWGDTWYMTLQIDERNIPLEGRSTIATWRVWQTTSITVWSTQVEVNSDNVITRVKVGNKWYDPMDKKAVVEGVTTPHNLGVVPVVSHTLMDEQWVGSAILPKARQHLNIESSWTWAGMYAGVVQRVFTPLPPTANDNPNLLLDPPDYSQLVSDNAHILIGSGFQFVETSGKAIDTLGGQLKAIKDDVKETVNVTFATVAQTVQQSGASKKVDLLLLQNALTTYGHTGSELDDEVLGLIAAWSGEAKPTATSNISYSLEDVETALDRSDRLMPHAEFLAPVTLREHYKKLQHLLLPDASQEVKKEIDEETPTFDAFDDADPPQDSSQGGLSERLVSLLGLTPDEAKVVLQQRDNETQ